MLISADVGVAATERIVAAVAAAAARGAVLRELVKDEIPRDLRGADAPPANGHRPHVVLIVGVNGTGKTTTVGKLAQPDQGREGRRRSSAPPTRFAPRRSSSSRSGRRAPASTSSARGTGADPGGGRVRRDRGRQGARPRRPMLVDTAGRLHTRVNLMNELDKIRRIAAREVEGAPHEVLLVLDATVGQNGLAQAREFMGVAGVNGIVLTKLDGTAKGGIAVAIAHDLKLPIRYVGVGEGIDD